MSKASAFRSEFFVIQERRSRPAGQALIVMLLVAAVVAGVAEVHYLPTFSADDVGAILFGLG